MGIYPICIPCVACCVRLGIAEWLRGREYGTQPVMAQEAHGYDYSAYAGYYSGYSGYATDPAAWEQYQAQYAQVRTNDASMLIIVLVRAHFVGLMVVGGLLHEHGRDGDDDAHGHDGGRRR